MDSYAREKASGVRHREKKKKKRRRPCITSRYVNIHNPVKLFLLAVDVNNVIIMYNLTTNNTSNILSEFPCSLAKKIAVVLLRIKLIILVS